jgi:hypothetical protein
MLAEALVLFSALADRAGVPRPLLQAITFI